MMSVFEPLFLLLLAIAIGTALTAAMAAMRREFPRAGRITRRLAIGIALYLAIAIAVSAVTPRRTYRVGDARCFDDWCITVSDAGRAPFPADTVYDVAIRFSNRARRMPMGEKGTVVYLEDESGRRFDPIGRPGDIPIDTVIPPGGTVATGRRFIVPRDVRIAGLVYTHEGGFPIGWLIISEGGWFARPPIVRFRNTRFPSAAASPGAMVSVGRWTYGKSRACWSCPWVRPGCCFGITCTSFLSVKTCSPAGGMSEELIGVKTTTLTHFLREGDDVTGLEASLDGELEYRVTRVGDSR